MEKQLTKTGQCYYRDEEGNLWVAESWTDALGESTTTFKQIVE